MEREIEKLIKIFDEYLISSGKEFISLRAAKQLIKRHDNLENVDLKSLLEANKIPHAYQTDSAPRQWQIPFSTPDTYDIEREEYFKARSVGDSTNLEPEKVPKSKSNWWAFIIVAIVMITIVGILTSEDHENTNSNTTYYNEPTKEFYQNTPIDNNTVDINELTGQKLSFKSTLNDKEYNGQIIQTNHETSYHTFDFLNKIVTQKSLLNGQWISITYPMKGYYKEAGLLASTYVIQVDELGVKEIWFSPEVPNIGYDYDDGSRIACYEITRVN